MDFPYEYRYLLTTGRWSPWYSITSAVAELKRKERFSQVRERKMVQP